MGWSESFERMMSLRAQVDENVRKLITQKPKRVIPRKGTNKSKVCHIVKYILKHILKACMIIKCIIIS